MSEPKRFDCLSDGMWQNSAGDYVLHSDYARLKAEVGDLCDAIKLASEVGIKMADEVTRLKAEVERLNERNKFLEQIDSYLQGANENAYEKRCDELEAEVERLRKAGDAVALDYAERIEIEAGETAKTLMKTVPVLRDWNAAKEGKQP